MPLDFGSATTSAFYVGSGTVSAIYQGSTQVWPPASSGPALVNHYSNTTTTASTTNTVTGVNAAVGSVLVLMACTAIGTTSKYITGVSAAGNTWTMRKQVIGAAGAANSGVEIWTATVTTALTSNTVTLTSSGGASLGTYDVSVWSGVTETGIVTASTTDGTGHNATPTCTVTTTGAAVVIGGFTRGRDTPPDSGPGAGFTTLAAGSSSGASTTNDYGASAYGIETTAGTYGPIWGDSTGGAKAGAAAIALPSL